MVAFLRVLIDRIRGFLRPDAHLDELDEELASHLDMATEAKIRQGLSPREARRQAHVELGNLTQLRDAARDARGLPWIGTSWLDLKLGLRMLRKTWGLTLVAGLAMVVVIAMAAVAFDGLAMLGRTELPLEQGEQLVVLQTWDRIEGDGVGASRQDVERWRGALRAFDDLGAFRPVERNLAIGETFDPSRPGEVVEVAEITASALAVARVAPLLGRLLDEADEHAGADSVVLIDAEVWRSRFHNDAGVVGRQVRLDGRVHTVVGVMPDGFGFPIAYRYWAPLRTPATSTSPELAVIGRLKDGVDRSVAEAELRRLGRLPGPAGSATDDEHIQLRVVPFTVAFTGGIDGWMAGVVLFFVSLLLIPPCINIAILVYARTVSRQGEMAARFVLGASRAHIVAQVFLEILVLASCAGVVALVVARQVIRLLLDDLQARGDSLPFWMHPGLSWTTVLFVGLLAVLAATIAGAVPALQVTGRKVQDGLRSLSGHTAVRLGKMWTALIVVQVALACALLPASVEMTWGTVRTGWLGPGFAADEFLTARVELSGGADVDQDGLATLRSRFTDRRAQLVDRLSGEAVISAVTVGSSVPGDGPWARIEVAESAESVSESGADSASAIHETRRALARIEHVGPAYFEAFDLPTLTGRSFEAGDFASGTHPVIVNQSFVIGALDGGQALGRRIRYQSLSRDEPTVEVDPERWFEIVGVIPDLEQHAESSIVYHPIAPEALTTATLIAQTRSDLTEAADRLRAVAWRLDPTLRVSEIRSLDEVYRQKAVGNYIGASGLVAATLSVLLLSAAGIYALMSFTVDRRRQEIGIRLALGAPPWRLIGSVFGRALRQVALGATVGVGLALLLARAMPAEDLGGAAVPWIVPLATAFMVAMACLALVGPARRGLRVEPIEELRDG